MSGFAGNNNVRIALFLSMTYDNKTKEIHKQVQGHGCVGCNSDQGSQYTSGLWAEACENKMKVGMEGCGRAKDNIWIKRFRRTIKFEYIYLNPCDNAIELRKGIENFMQYYNTERHHQGIEYEIPKRIYENNKLLNRTHEAARCFTLIY